jgi:hypothetical protein
MLQWIRLFVAVMLACLVSEARADETSTELQLPGYSYHFGSPQQPGRHWTDFHDGLGVQRTSRGDDWTVRYTAGFMRDSYNNQGLYAGGAIGLRLATGDVEWDLSAAPMLLYRTMRFDDARGKAPMKLIPAIMPILAFEHRATGIGGNITVLPGGNFGKDLHFPGLVYIQFTYRLH